MTKETKPFDITITDLRLLLLVADPPSWFDLVPPRDDYDDLIGAGLVTIDKDLLVLTGLGREFVSRLRAHAAELLIEAA